MLLDALNGTESKELLSSAGPVVDGLAACGLSSRGDSVTLTNVLKSVCVEEQSSAGKSTFDVGQDVRDHDEAEGKLSSAGPVVDGLTERKSSPPGEPLLLFSVAPYLATRAGSKI